MTVTKPVTFCFSTRNYRKILHKLYLNFLGRRYNYMRFCGSGLSFGDKIAFPRGKARYKKYVVVLMLSSYVIPRSEATWESVSPSSSLPCQREVARAQPVSEGFRSPESCPKNGIPQSAPLTAPFNKGAKGRELRIAASGFALLAMTGNGGPSLHTFNSRSAASAAPGCRRNSAPSPG